MREAGLCTLDVKGRSVEKTMHRRLAMLQGRFQAGKRGVPSMDDQPLGQSLLKCFHSRVRDVGVGEVESRKFRESL
jgi:hypothetical protein